MCRAVIRGLFQVWAWVLLVFLFAVDYKAVEYVRHGPDIIHFDNDGLILPRPPLSASDWMGLLVLIAAQAFMALALYRSYRRKPRVRPQ
jgi:hypothetical protein